VLVGSIRSAEDTLAGAAAPVSTLTPQPPRATSRPVKSVFLAVIVGLAAACSGGDEAAVTPVERDEEDLTQAVDVIAVGDIACKPGQSVGTRQCQHAATADLVPDTAKRVLLLGDNQYSRGELASYEGSFDGTWGRHMERLLPVPGNHEYQTKAAAGYFAYFGEKAADPAKGYYAADVGAWRVLALNTNDNCKRIPCDEGSEQIEFVKQDLAEHPTKCSLAYFHHPRWSSGEHGDNEAMDFLWRTLVEAGVDVVLAGHDHDYERFAPRDAEGARDDTNGIRSFVVGTGGIGFRKLGTMSDHSEIAQADTFGVLKLSLRARSYSWEFLPIEGSTSEFTDAGKGKCH
jgi:acid phosphatase type 7